MDLSQSLQILLLIVVLLALVCWFFSAKTWRWHTLTLVVLNFFAAVAFVYLAMRTLQTQKEWRNKVRDLDTAIAKEEQNAHDLLLGSLDENQQPQMGIHQLRDEINRATLGRGRVWRKEKVESATNGSLTLGWDSTEPHGLTKKSVVEVFDDKDVDKGGQYLGEFAVTNPGEKKIELAFVGALTQKDAIRLSNATTVSLYEVMPIDDTEAYLRGVSDKTRESLIGKLPPEVQAEFKKPDRSLRDYAFYFDDLRRQMTLAQTESTQTSREIAALKTVQTKVKDAVAAETAEAAALAIDLEQFQREKAILIKYVDKLTEHFIDLAKQANAVFNRNSANARLIVSLNARAIEAINRRESSAGTPSGEDAKNPATGAFLKAP